MGELDNKPFHEAMKRKYGEEEAEDRASELCSMWEEYLRDPDWHPLRVIEVDGKHEVCTLHSFLFSIRAGKCYNVYLVFVKYIFCFIYNIRI